jgi:hypothetical protein
MSVLQWICVGLFLADLVTTLIGARLAGSNAEDNPVWQRVLVRHGPAAFAVAYAAVAGVLLLAMSWLGREALIGMIAVLALVAVNNLLAVFRLLRR